MELRTPLVTQMTTLLLCGASLVRGIADGSTLAAQRDTDWSALPQCGCSQASHVAGYRLSNGINIVPDASKCIEPVADYCSPVLGTDEGVHVCDLDDLDVLLPTSYSEPEDRGHESWGHWISSIYARYLCKHKHEGRYCVAGGQTVPAYDADVFDFGADPSGRQLQSLSKYARGALAGFNVKVPYEGQRPALDVRAGHAGNYSLVFGNRDACLPFHDASFDLVTSINVLEHVQPIERYLSEAVRVLRPGGLLYAEYQPHWWSPRGHHLQAGVMQTYLDQGAELGEAGCREVKYENDGTIVPDWGHLYMGAKEFHNALAASPLGRCPHAVQQAVHFVYYNDTPYGMNKVHARDVMFYLETALNLSRVEVHMQPGVDLHVPYRAAERIGSLHGHGDVLFSKIVLQYTKPLTPS